MVTHPTTRCNSIEDYDGEPEVINASELMAAEAKGTTEKVLKQSRRVARANPEPGEMPAAPARRPKASHLGHAARIYQTFGKPLAFFAGKFWALDIDKGWMNVTNEIAQLCDEAEKRDGSKSILPLIARRITVPDYGDDDADTIYWQRPVTWDRTPWAPVHVSQSQVIFSDGVYDCATDEFEESTNATMFGPRLSVPYYAEVVPRCAEFEAMVTKMIPDPEIRRHFQEVAGTVLQPHHLLRGQVVLWGPPKSGKTTLATAIGCAAVGRRGLGSTSEYSLVTNKWAVADLLGKFINISDDSRHVKGWPGFAKSYTSGRITVEVKLQMPITTLGTAKLWSTCNQMQEMADSSNAMEDRLFPFKVHGRVDAATEDTQKMTIGYWCDPARRAGIVTWLLEGLKRYWQRGKFDFPTRWLADKSDAVDRMDPLAGWLRAHLTQSTGELPRPQLIEKLPQDLLPRHNMDAALADYMKRLFGVESKRVERNGERIRLYPGVDWKD